MGGSKALPRRGGARERAMAGKRSSWNKPPIDPEADSEDTGRRWSEVGVRWVVATDCAANNDSMNVQQELRLVAGLRSVGVPWSGLSSGRHGAPGGGG